jgi:hypothetical protein
MRDGSDNMESPIKIYENMIWEILDEGSKLTLISILMDQGFEGNCKLIAKINGETTILEVNDETGHNIVLPINILDILNE